MAAISTLKTWFLNLDNDHAPTEEGRARRARRRRILNSSAAGRIYLPRIRKLFARLDAIPGAYVEDGDLASALALLGKTFDALAAAIWHFSEAYLRLPGLDEATQKAAQAIRDEVLPSLAITKATYTDEAAFARDLESKLVALAATLARFPVVGGTLADWVLRLVETGKGLGETHAERALSRAVGEVDRSEVKVLRGQILHEILQFRATLRDELEDTADADFEGGEALVFGYFDELTAS